ncbi:DUF6682 family protein [Cupriavidus sp. UYPR2.512]|uniref:phage adaptor protein n=1 Tax=Cupriavidus sp. UYPR2.512 TaxID=1080187 RepID=UPI000372B42B|nr:DUF6682 family protein [Cupriavidus sp. UYPR2.512]UIF90857.1 hypothetical protein KAF44_32225 [Cupriavidus necator]
MPSVLIRDALFRVSTLLLDAEPQFVRWTERELVGWLDDGQVAIAKYLPIAGARVDAIKLKQGTKQSLDTIASTDVKPGDGSTPATVHGNALNELVRNMGADGLTPGRAIRVISRDVLDAQNPNWHTTTGAKVEAFVYDPRTPKYFYVYPAVPASPAMWVEASYLANPAPIPNTGTSGTPRYGKDGSDAGVIGVDDKYLDDLVNYVVARAYMKDSEYATNAGLANTFASMFLSSLNSQVQALTGNNPNLQVLPLNPAVPAAAR